MLPFGLVAGMGNAGVDSGFFASKRPAVPCCVAERICRLMIKTFALFVATALAEITGCYLPWLWLRKGGSAWLLVPACLSLALFAWLLTLHPAASGRVYAAYGCVYVVTALLWLRIVDGVALANTDILGGLVALAGMGIIVWGWGNSV